MVVVLDGRIGRRRSLRASGSIRAIITAIPIPVIATFLLMGQLTKLERSCPVRLDCVLACCSFNVFVIRFAVGRLTFGAVTSVFIVEIFLVICSFVSS